MILGVDYYPEHWPMRMMDEDIKRIVGLGANTVRIGEFAWHMMEKEEGKYDFSFFDGVIEKLKTHGLKVIFGTPTATFPAWLSKKHPDILAMDITGKRHAFGGRRQYCYNAPVYRQKTREIVTALLKHYENEPAIIAWQIDNELGHEGSDQCFCPTCESSFQAFLTHKYHVIENLNEAYGTIFWGQTYNDFSEIPMPTATITCHNPTLLLDWARFRSESINTYAALQVEIVEQFKQAHQSVTHNLFGGFFDRAYDQNILAEKLDVVSYDNYPVWGGLEAPLSPAHIAMTLDYIRGLKQKNFWIVEELMGAQGHTVIGYLPRPNQGKLWAMQAMARGCEALLFFRWRGMTRGAEQFCQGILDADNQENDKFREVASFFREVKENESVFYEPIKAEVAILYDYDNRWSWAAQPQSHAFNFTDEFVRLYEGFHRLNVMTDVLSVEKDFSPYKIIVLPVMQVVSESLLERLDAFAANGGTVILGFRSGIKDKDNNLNLGINKTHDFCGIEITNYESLGHGIQVELLEVPEKVSIWRDLITPKNAKALYHYKDAYYTAYAAATVKHHHNGKVYYLGGGFEQALILELTKRVCKEQGLICIDTPEGVESIKRGDHVIVVNHNTFEVQINPIY